MKGFTIYKEYWELITLLPKKKEQEELLYEMAKYMFEDEEPSLNDRQLKIFKNLKRPLDISKNNSLRSKGYGAPKGNQNALKKQTENKPKTNQKSNQKQTHQDVDVNVYVNDNVNVNKDNIKKEYFSNQDVNNLFLKFLDIRKQMKVPNTEIALERLINKLNKYDDDTKLQMIDESIMNGWKGVFEPKAKNKSKDKKSNSEEQWDLIKGVYDGTIQFK